MLLVEEQPSGPVYILLRTPKIIDGHYDPRHPRLEFPSAAVITEMPDRPQQQRRSHDVEETQQSNEERQVRIEHVFRAADDMATA